MQVATITAPAVRLHVRVAWLCGVVLLLEGYDIAAVGYAIPSMVDAWKVQPSIFTHAITAGNIGLMIGSLCAGLLGDRLGRKPVLIICVFLFGIFSLLSALSQSPSQLEVMRFLTGLGLGGGLPISVALMSDFVPPRTHGRLVILIMTAVPIGFTAGGLLATWLVSRFGWPAIFVAGGALPLAAAPLLLFWLPDSGASLTRRPSRAMVIALFQDDLAWRTVLLWLITTFSYLGIYFILAWLPAILHRSGISSSKAILGTTIYGLGVIVCPPLTALIVNRIRTEVVLTTGLTFGALCVLAIGILDPQFWLLSLLLCGVGVGGGCQAGINTLSALSYPQRIRSTGTGWALGAGRVGTIAGPLIGGLLLGLGLPTRSMFIAAAIPALATSIFMFLLGRVRHVGSESANG